MKKSHLTIFCSLSGITGIIIGLTSPSINIPYFLLFLAFLLFLLINLFIKIIHPIYILIIVGLIFGIWRSQSVLYHLSQSNINQIMGQNEIIGTIIYPPEINNNQQKLIISNIKHKTSEIKGNILIKMGRYPPLQYNETVKITGDFSQIENFNDKFSYTGYLALKNILAISDYPKIELIKTEPNNLYSYLYNFREKLLEIIKNNLPATNAGLLAGLLLGEKKILPNDIYQQFINLGLSHIIVVSGYNLTLFSQLFNKNLIGLIHRRTAYILTVFFMIIFTIITGAEASIVRALIMSLLMISAPMFSRLPHHINAILIAASLMIFFNPLIIFYDVGFHLSFLATLGLVFISPILTKFTAHIQLPEIIKNTSVETISATLSTLPYSIYQFSRLPLYLLPANLIILPITGLTTIMGIAFIILSALPFHINTILLIPINTLLSFMLYFAKWFSRLPFTVIPISIAQFSMAITYIVLIIIIFMLNQNLISTNK